jgi:hypothetical protein
MNVCQYPGCGTELTSASTRGRPAKYCPKHARARKREQDMARRLISREPEYISKGLPQCCLDWRKAGRANRKYCPQHQEWQKFIGQSRNWYRTSVRQNGQATGRDKELLSSLFDSPIGYRTRVNPDSWIPMDEEDVMQDEAVASLACIVSHLALSLLARSCQWHVIVAVSSALKQDKSKSKGKTKSKTKRSLMVQLLP